MISSNEILERAARDGFIESKDWEGIVTTVLARLQDIVYKEFPLPQSPPPTPATPPHEVPSSPPKGRTADLPSPETSLLASQGDNILQSTPPQSSDPPVEPPSVAPSRILTAKDSSPPAAPSPDQANNLPTLPVELQNRFDYIRHYLVETFTEHPPHTIQRLSELVLYPRQHYRYLPAYLNALERVVSVSSGANIFPLPSLDPSLGSGPIVNGTSTTSDKLHGDESVGGALLTPIPWLQNGARATQGTAPITQSLGEPASSHEEDDAQMSTDDQLLHTGPVTQGELLRKEQEVSEPPTPVGSASSNGTLAASQAAHTAGAAAARDESEEATGESPKPDNELPHARGPDDVGMSDLGPQEHPTGSRQILDMEAAVGRGPHHHHIPPTVSLVDNIAVADIAVSADAEDDVKPQVEQPSQRDPEGDIQLTDVDIDGMTSEDMRQAQAIVDTQDKINTGDKVGA